MKLQAGDILLIDSNSIIAKIIKFFTHSDWSHAAIMVNDFIGYEANYPRVEPFDIHKYSVLLSKKKVNKVAVLRHVDLKEINEIKASRIKAILRLEVYTSYDVGGLLAYLFRKRRLESRKKWFCSEIIAHAYRSLGIAIGKEKHEWEVSPDSIWNDNKFELIGYLK